MTVTVVVSVGIGPLPSLITLYCKPEGSVTTPGFFLLAARNFSPAALLGPNSFIIVAVLMASILVWATSWAVSGVISPGLPYTPVMKAASRFFSEMVLVESEPKASWFTLFTS